MKSLRFLWQNALIQFLYKYWMKFAELLAYVNMKILLTALYFLVYPFFAVPYQIVKLFHRKKTSTWTDAQKEIDMKEQF